MMSPIFRICFLLFICFNCAYGQRCPQRPIERQFKRFGTKTTYENARILLYTKVGVWTPPRNFLPIAMYAFIRHGIRYPDREKIIKIQEFIKQNQFPSYLQNENCRNTSWAVTQWSPDDDNRISQSGAFELEGIAARMLAKYPILFERLDQLDVGISTKSRTNESAAAFFKGLQTGNTKSAGE